MQHAFYKWIPALVCLAILLSPQGAVCGAESRTLVISGFNEDDVTRQFLALHPDIRIRYDDEKQLSADRLIQAMITRDHACDIFVINNDWGLDALGRKGYFFDLSGSEAIAALCRGWYPQVRDALSVGSKIIAYPIALSMDVWGIDTSLSTLCPLFTPPQDFLSFLQGLQSNEDIRDTFGASYVIEVPGRERLMRKLVQSVLLSGEQSAVQANFNQDAFLLCAETIRKMPEPEPVDEYLYDVLYQLPTYLSLSQDLLDPNSPYTLTAPAPLFRGQTPAIETVLTVMVVNPYSQNADLALEYLQFRTTHETPKTAYLLSPKPSKPLENPAYQGLRAERQKRIASLTALLEDAPPEEAYELREQIDLLARESAREHSRWIISPECLAAYRAIAPSMYIVKGSPLLGVGGEGLFATIAQAVPPYLQHQIDAAQLAEQLTQKAGFLYAESQ
ncbi:MAG: hypothetical protein VB099_04055 [Candidatus Limiplasma sp.]|nr:hypothetical protein [Candidatus Limiplasma sp.]